MADVPDATEDQVTDLNALRSAIERTRGEPVVLHASLVAAKEVEGEERRSRSSFATVILSGAPADQPSATAPSAAEQVIQRAIEEWATTEGGPKPDDGVTLAHYIATSLDRARLAADEAQRVRNIEEARADGALA